MSMLLAFPRCTDCILGTEQGFFILAHIYRYGIMARKMKLLSFIFTAFLLLSASAERHPYERYQSIVDRQMFGEPPVGFDRTKPPSTVSRSSKGGFEAEQLSQEQQQIKSAIHFSVINVTPQGETAVGFTDNGNAKQPVHYYLKVGESRNGWTVKEADPVKATMTIAKGEVEVSLSIGDNSAKGPAKAAAGQEPSERAAVAPLAAGARAGLLGSSLRNRRMLREQRRQEQEKKAQLAVAEAQQAVEEAKKRQEERDRLEAEEKAEQRAQLQQIREELRKSREEAERARAEQAQQNGVSNEGENQ